MTPFHKLRGQMSESMLTASFVILSGGLQDAYTYLCRGKVFANGQTGNIVLFSAYLFDGAWDQCLRYLVPVLSFMTGIFAAECIHRRFKAMEKVHWRTDCRGPPSSLIHPHRTLRRPPRTRFTPGGWTRRALPRK